MDTRCFLDSPITQCLNDEVGEGGTMKVTKISLKKFKQKGAARSSIHLKMTRWQSLCRWSRFIHCETRRMEHGCNGLDCLH